MIWASPGVPAVPWVSRAVWHLRAVLAAPARSTANAEGPAQPGASATPSPGRGETRSSSLSRWVRSPEPGTGEPAASPSIIAARWSRDSRSVVMMSELTASEPDRIFSSTASIPLVNRAIDSRPTIAAAPSGCAPREMSDRGARGPPGAAPGPSALLPGRSRARALLRRTSRGTGRLNSPRPLAYPFPPSR